MKRFPSPRRASATHIVRPLESIAETTASVVRNAPKCDQAVANELIRVLDEIRRECCLGNEHEKPNKGHAGLKILAEHIAQQLKEREFCVAFEGDLDRCWPSSGMSQAERERKIQDFAESQGWIAAILDAGFGTRAILWKLEPGIIAASI